MSGIEVLNISQRKLASYPELQISKKVVNTEAMLYLHEYKNKWMGAKELLKIFYDNSPVKMNDKLYIITKLIELNDKIKMEELVFPKALISVDNILSGYSMPWIKDNVNLILYLQNPNVANEIKLKYLKEILKILTKLEQKQSGFVDKFYLGDIHEANFIFDLEEQIVKAVDLDGGYFKGALAPESKFLSFNKNLCGLPNRYPTDSRNERYIANMNTTYLSFVYIFLNSISMDKSYKWDYETYYRYIDYLDSLGVNSALVQKLGNVFSDEPNFTFNIELLDDFDTDKDYTLKKVR